MIGPPEAQYNIIDKFVISTKPLAWPDVVMAILPLDKVKKLGHYQEYSVERGQDVRVLVKPQTKSPANNYFGWGIWYTVEKHGNRVYLVGLVNDDWYGETCELGKFVEFRKESKKRMMTGED